MKLQKPHSTVLKVVFLYVAVWMIFFVANATYGKFAYGGPSSIYTNCNAPSAGAGGKSKDTSIKTPGGVDPSKPTTPGQTGDNTPDARGGAGTFSDTSIFFRLYWFTGILFPYTTDPAYLDGYNQYLNRILDQRISSENCPTKGSPNSATANVLNSGISSF